MDNLLRLPAVMARVGLKRSAIYERIALNTFPKPIPLGSVSAWAESEIAAWIEKQKAERHSILAERRAATLAKFKRQPEELAA